LHQRHLERGRGAGAGVLDIDDRRRAERQALQRHLPANAELPFHRVLCCIREGNRLDVGMLDPCIGQRQRDCFLGEAAQAAVEEAAEAGHADADDENLAHKLLPAHCLWQFCRTILSYNTSLGERKRSREFWNGGLVEALRADRQRRRHFR
jgi:hypothetical protein